MRIWPLALLLAVSACRKTIEDISFTEDLDGDGVVAADDCNDDDATVFPDADELCDGIDNNCNEAIDEDAVDALLWYRDGDRDGFGDETDSVMACDPPADRILQGGDCDDGDDDINPDGTETCDGVDEDCDGLIDNDAVDGDLFYTDADGDGLGDPESSFLACALPDGASLDPTDCDDTLDTAYPGAPELCNGIDDDCDGDIDDNAGDVTLFYVDIDGDGYGSDSLTEEACAAPPGFTDNSQDCDDSRDEAFPGAIETCNELDDNCDGFVDEDAVDPSIFYVDADQDNYGDPENTVLACLLPEGAVENNADCDDTRDRVFPGGTELCNGLDDDCNGEIDDDAADTNPAWVDSDGDGFGQRGSSSIEVCEVPDGYAANQTDCADDNSAIAPFTPETCNGTDDDCDGETDESATDALTFYGDSDEDGFGAQNVQVQACEAPDGFVSDSTDCDDGDALAYPEADERCNSADDDCDGEIDEDAINLYTYYADVDGDRYGSPDTIEQACSAPDGFVADGTDCDDDRRLTFPGAPELCNDIDDDCDEVVDNDAIDGTLAYIDSDGDGYGAPGSDIVIVCDLDGYADNDADCTDDDALIFPGGDDSCTVTECPQDGSEGTTWIATDAGEAFEAWCDGDGWMRVAHLEAGPRDQASVYRGDRFLTTPFVQGMNTPTVVSDNGGVLLDGTNFGMFDGTAMWQGASELRYACEDVTRGHTASAVLDLATVDRDALMNSVGYNTTTTDVAYTYDGIGSTPAVYLTWSNAGYWGSWHICGSGNSSQGTSPDGWQLGMCATAPGVSDSNRTDVPQIAIGFHPGFAGIRLECGNDSPNDTTQIDGSFSMWLR